MDILWSPWRAQYIEGFKEENLPKEDCFFCAAISDLSHDRDRLVVHRSKLSIVMLNRYPYNGGHILIAPKMHIGDFLELSNEESSDLMNLAKLSIKVINSLSSPHAYNMGMNLGREAGAGVPGHLHLHIIPRWSGDTNFMSSVCETKVISQSLENIQKNFSIAFAKLS
jgi:ATP adenylyltransferase